MDKTKNCLSDYLTVTIPLAIIFYLLRVFEYFTAGIKLAASTNFIIAIIRWFYFDTCTWLIYIALLFIPFLLFYIINRKAGRYFLLVINGLTIIGLFSLLIVFSERLVPFDHELFVRNGSESFTIIKNVVTGRFWINAPVILYLAGYYVLYAIVFSGKKISGIFILTTIVLSFFSLIAIRYTRPSFKNYAQFQEYYLVTNKLYYFTADSYSYLRKNRTINTTNKEEVSREIDYFWKVHPNRYVDKEYPLLHIDESQNVLKDFFRTSDTIPNIVIIITEGLSTDFSGDDATAGSYTPFLDSLARHSLSWYNTLSSAQGTFGSLPSITGSLPYGSRGFTQLSEPTEHITLVKILKKNNWNTCFFAGCDINYDNFAGFMRMQGTDFILEKFGSKYKKMGIGPEGWSAGYPDDALFRRSLEALDSINRSPYLSVYLTLTTHTPFIFAQSAQYLKRFDRELKNRKISQSEKRNLSYYRPMLAAFLFLDDCFRDFFNAYKKRKDFKNTIFIITGDHHHGFFPTRNMIDDYNVPLIIYSPLLRKGVKFNSVNSHLNITPTILAYLKDSYHLKYFPRYVPWMGGGLDTSIKFRNIHQMPFMLTNRNIDDYLYNNSYIAGDQIYSLMPDLKLQALDDDTLQAKMIRYRENFKFINAYVCQSNKLFPSSENIYDAKEKEIYTFSENNEQNLKATVKFLRKIKNYSPPLNYKKIGVKISFLTKFSPSDLEKLPVISTSIFAANNIDTLHLTIKKVGDYINKQKINDGWYSYEDDDIYNLENFHDPKGHIFHIDIWNQRAVNLKLKNLTINFFGLE